MISSMRASLLLAWAVGLGSGIVVAALSDRLLVTEFVRAVCALVLG